MRIVLFLYLFLWIALGSFPSTGYGKDRVGKPTKPVIAKKRLAVVKDTTAKDSIPSDSLPDLSLAVTKKIEYNSIQNAIMPDPARLSLFPAVSLQQFLKGNSAGVYIQEETGEPGTNQNIFIRGASTPLLSKRDLYDAQPLIVLDGIPITYEHPFAYDVQEFDINRMGTATNPLSGIDMDNVGSVEILKDIAQTSLYGPRAANGVILIKTKTAGSKRKITFNSYIGMVQRPNVTTLNGAFENKFRKQFYDIYTADGTAGEDAVYPLYLSDSINSAYYGPSNWTDLYYQNAMVHSINAGISGGTDKANFRFSLGNLKNDGIADETSMDRYSTMFSINMKPIKWLTFSTVINANRVERDRNRNMRDRFAQMNYLPELGAPLSPNKDIYARYLSFVDRGFDINKTNLVQGYAQLGFDIRKFKLVSRFGVDFNEGFRDVFNSKELNEQNNYSSNYYGSNQRLLVENTLTYDTKLANEDNLYFELGQSFQFDTYRYSNAYALKGTNDFIKLNLLESNPASANYLDPLNYNKFLVQKIVDRTKIKLFSFYGKGTYSIQDKYSFSLQLRSDGASSQQPTKRWFYSPVVSAQWNVAKDLASSGSISALNLRASAGRIGRIQSFDQYSQGPQYTAQIGFTGNTRVPGYNGFSVLTRPYSSGWIGYDLPWAYSDQLNIGVDFGFNKRINASLDFYTRSDKDQILGVPGLTELGYTQEYKSGMSINNTGIDFTVTANILPQTQKFSWTSSINVNYNTNKLKALPNGLKEQRIGSRLLKVGESVDQYWLLQNEGIYTSDEAVPGFGTEKVLSYSTGNPFKGGDPKWKDINGDFIINDDDRVLQGHYLPVAAGGFDNRFKLKNWDLNLNFYYNIGRDLINQEMAKRFDFVNQESGRDINSVKEITFWEKRGDYDKYPIYNPWSPVLPYQSEQNLFLEDASFVKLRSISIGYDLGQLLKKKNKTKISRLYVYGTANNLFTITPYSGRDPELVGYTGFDSGYSMPIPRTYTVGVKMDL